MAVPEVISPLTPRMYNDSCRPPPASISAQPMTSTAQFKNIIAQTPRLFLSALMRRRLRRYAKFLEPAKVCARALTPPGPRRHTFTSRRPACPSRSFSRWFPLGRTDPERPINAPVPPRNKKYFERSGCDRCRISVLWKIGLWKIGDARFRPEQDIVVFLFLILTLRRNTFSIDYI